MTRDPTESKSDGTYEVILGAVPEFKKARPAKPTRAGSAQRGQDRVRSINSGNYDPKRADARLKKFDEVER